MTSPDADRSPFLTTLLQSFFIIPFWDVQSLAKMTQSGTPELRRRLTNFGGALLVAVIGWWALRWLFPGDCCQVSTVLYPGESAASLIWPRLTTTFGMLAFIAVSGLIIIGLPVGISVILRRLALSGIAGTASNTLRWMIMSLLASPPGHLSILVVLLLGIRFGLLPVPAGRSAGGLIAPAGVVALLPALIAARRVERSLPDPLAHADQAILLAATTFYRQASWLVGGLALAEAIFGVDGLGKLLVDALRAGDAALFLPLLLLFMIATALCRLHVIRLETTRSVPSTKELPDDSLVGNSERWLRWTILGIVLTIPLALSFGGSTGLQLDPAAVYASPSFRYPWGTDGLGRDVLTLARLALRHGWLIALTGGLVSVGLGGLWSSGIMWLWDRNERAMADMLRIPAEALILLVPSPLMLWLLLHTYGSTLSIASLGALAGLTLIPRMVWGMGDSKPATLRPVELLRRVGAYLATGGFSALQIGLMTALVEGRGAAGTITPGGTLAAYQDMIGGANLLNGGPYLRLALGLALPGLALAWGWYLLADALTDPQTADGLADLLG